MKYYVFAFYPNLGIKIRVTDHESKYDLYEYLRGLIYTETPFMAYKVSRADQWQLVDKQLFDLSSAKCIELIGGWMNREHFYALGYNRCLHEIIGETE